MRFTKNAFFSSVLMLGLIIAGNASSKTMKLGHDAPPDAMQNVTHAYAAVLKSAVEAGTNGGIEIEIYPNNQLGNSEERLQQVRRGLIQGSTVSIGTLATVYPEIDMLNLPFAFKNMASVYRVFDGDFGIELAKGIDNKLKDVVVLSILDPGGFFAISNSKNSIKTLDDFKGLRIRTMTVPAHQKLIQSIGGEAYPLAWSEVYTGLQTGVVDGQMNPLPTIYRANLFEVQKYTTITKHLYNPFFFVVNKKFYDGLSEEEKNILKDGGYEAVVATRGLGRISEALNTEELKKKLEVNTLDQKNFEEFRTKAISAMDLYFDKSLSPEGKALLNSFKKAVDQANGSVYLQ